MNILQLLEALQNLIPNKKITQAEIARVINSSRANVNDRIKRKSEVSVSELQKIEEYYNVQIYKSPVRQKSVERIVSEDNAKIWREEFGDRLDMLQKYFEYSNEKMAEILSLSPHSYLSIIIGKLKPNITLLDSIKDNFSGFTIDEILYDSGKTFETKLQKKSDDKIEIDVNNLSPEKIAQIKAILKEN